MNQRREIDGDGGFVKTAFFDEIILRSLRYMQAGYPVHFVGPSGVGKTSLALYIAKQFNRPVTVIRGHHEMSNKDLLGHHYGVVKREVVDNYIRSVYKTEKEIKPIWVQGQLIDAVKNGHIVIYDEFSRSRPETNNIFLALLEEKILPVYGKEKETFVKCHPNFSIIFTSNPDEYAGTFHTQDALLDRLITINLDYCDKETEAEIIRKKIEISELEAKEVVRLVSNLRSYGKRFCPSLRASLMIATIAKEANIPISPGNKDYQTLCFDVLTRPVNQNFPDLKHKEIKELILQEMLRREEG
ncbi:gas vesicle protein GvpN [Neobacillus sp. SAB-20_R2A]|uniref:gas vesicle protein GvpN n=1 Tax=Neobacillus sp. SAB-20_R2A TaxID=3120519 RepID=UPI003C6E26FD